MQAKLPVLAATDANTDIGEIIVNNGFGWWCESNNIEDLYNKVVQINNENLFDMGKKALQYLIDNYSVKMSYRIIVDGINAE